MADKIQKAYLYAKEAPSKEQFSRFQAFVHEKYGEDVVLEFRESEDFEGGFALRCGAEAYDWSNAGLLKQFKAGIALNLNWIGVEVGKGHWGGNAELGMLNSMTDIFHIFQAGSRLLSFGAYYRW